MKTSTKNMLRGIAVMSTVDYLLFRLRRRGPSREPVTVAHVDIARYMGKWYEIARYPVPYEKDCFAVTAEYTLKPDGSVMVLNTCRQGSPDGPLKATEGTATVVDTETNAKLKVRFIWPFAGDYWIIDLGGDYEYAVAGSPDRKGLWILSRTPQMDDVTYDRILLRLGEQGYDTAKLIKTPHA